MGVEAGESEPDTDGNDRVHGIIEDIPEPQVMVADMVELDKLINDRT